MALVLSRKVGEVVYANDVALKVLAHYAQNGDKLATVEATYPDGSTQTAKLTVNSGNRMVITTEPYAAVELSYANRHCVRLRLYGEKGDVLFLRAELKGE